EAPKVTTYKVQLGVFAAKKDPSVFKTLTDISDEEVAGKYKYYSGSFATKAEAEKRIEEAKKLGFSGAFVVPFVDGKRAN
ncbi:MAG: SPOR domain-containing protein, partial [Flavobacteriales bacterium]